MTTIVSSTSNPRASSNEKKAMKLKSILVARMTTKVIRNVSGIAAAAIIASRIPNTRKMTRNTKRNVIIKSRTSSENCLLTMAPESRIEEIVT